MNSSNHNALPPDISKLWEYIDGTLPAPEMLRMEELLQTQQSWQEQYQELLELNRMLQENDLEQPSMRFTKNVMDEIAKQHIAPAASTYINKNIIRGIGIFFLSMIAISVVYLFSQFNWASTSQIELPVNTEKLEDINVSKWISNSWINAFMLINVVLGLYFLDRYFQWKKKEKANQAA